MAVGGEPLFVAGDAAMNGSFPPIADSPADQQG
jgi:hypothetical protein